MTWASFWRKKLPMTPWPWGPRPMQPTPIRLLGATLPDFPSADDGTMEGNAAADMTIPLVALRKSRRVRRFCFMAHNSVHPRAETGPTRQAHETLKPRPPQHRRFLPDCFRPGVRPSSGAAIHDEAGMDSCSDALFSCGRCCARGRAHSVPAPAACRWQCRDEPIPSVRILAPPPSQVGTPRRGVRGGPESDASPRHPYPPKKDGGSIKMRPAAPLRDRRY